MPGGPELMPRRSALRFRDGFGDQHLLTQRRCGLEAAALERGGWTRVSPACAAATVRFAWDRLHLEARTFVHCESTYGGGLPLSRISDPRLRVDIERWLSSALRAVAQGAPAFPRKQRRRRLSG